MDLRKRVSDWFSRVRNLKTRTVSQDEASVAVVADDPDLERALWRFEPYVMKVQSVLIWENPMISVLCVVVVNILFWLVVNFQWRFYGLLFTLVLTAILYDVWAQKCWPEISVSLSEKTKRTLQVPPTQTRVLTVPEISHYLSQAQSLLRDYYIWLKNMRDDQPGTFCCFMCASFLVLAVIGRTVPGSVIGYTLVMALMAGPGVCIHLLPPTVVQRLKSFCVAFKEKGRDTDSEVDDYLPEQTGENLALLQQAGEPVDDEQQDDSIVPEEFGLELEAAAPDSSLTQTSFVTGMNVMPSHDEGSTDGLDISEFDLSAPPSQHGNNGSNMKTKQELEIEQSDTDEDDIAEIHFQSSHFNGDSSEEEEKAFVQGLNFDAAAAEKEADKAAVPHPNKPAASGSLGEILASTAVQAVARNIADITAMGQSLISTVIGAGAASAPEGGAQARQRQNVPSVMPPDQCSSSSSDSDDFEMISQDDLS